ncbi:uncharacterized protein LOC131146629 isoform X1 [Malania oleifera]|uniref:uncharacterized protein LOC131146629 isoform X1 n=1 Tax=Malania oleifera TaxID=397392 RepID=UPI0025AE1F8B|nr:uncharacterized protein LOC131146629 isoform X1 [Malania oleifera]
MPHLHLRLSALHPPLIPDILLRPHFDAVLGCADYQSNMMQSNLHKSLCKIMSPSSVFIRSCSGVPSLTAVPISTDAGETSEVGKHYQLDFRTDFPEKTLNNEVQLEDYFGSDMSYREIQKRRKIGLANKGRVPWNKGRTHGADLIMHVETCELIKLRTIEALKDPKVRKKMSEFSYAHSEQSEARIQSSLRRIWGQRLKWKWLRERLYFSWMESIADAAKKGGTDQQELEWDSYDKLKEEMAVQQLQWVADKAKEMAEQRAGTRVQARAKKLAKLH